MDSRILVYLVSFSLLNALEPVKLFAGIVCKLRALPPVLASLVTTAQLPTTFAILRIDILERRFVEILDNGICLLYSCIG